MYPSLRAKRVVVTGGASGIGLATAARFVREGAAVGILDRNSEALERALTGELAPTYGAVADVSDQEQCTSALADLAGKMGGLDVLVANAGVSERTRFIDIPPAQWKRVMSTNLDGVFYCIQYAARRMHEAKSGAILVTASTNGFEGHPYYADYNASKAAVMLLVRTLALEVAPHVRVNAVCPGYVMTPMQLAEYTPEMIEEVNRSIPLKRHAEPLEVAALFAFLASSEAQYITGQCICIDGGETA
jgi:meso-butanediol dehydrogenase/(S,S)-butanediol dehydrogenase/diacetyl reductase